jgi:hypothetical protein
VAELHVLLNGPMLAYRHFLKSRLVESLTAVIIPLDDSVLFVRLFNYSQLASGYSEVAQALDAISGTQFFASARAGVRDRS